MARVTVGDREAIRELLHLYCRYVDDGDTDKLVDLFAEDGRFEVEGASPQPGDPVVGHQALCRMAEGLMSGGLHLSANALVAVDGDQATAASYVLVLAGPGDPTVLLGGRYHDSFCRRDGKWLFASRRLSVRARRSPPPPAAPPPPATPPPPAAPPSRRAAAPAAE